MTSAMLFDVATGNAISSFAEYDAALRALRTMEDDDVAAVEFDDDGMAIRASL